MVTDALTLLKILRSRVQKFHLMMTIVKEPKQRIINKWYEFIKKDNNNTFTINTIEDKNKTPKRQDDLDTL